MRQKKVVQSSCRPRHREGWIVMQYYSSETETILEEDEDTIGQVDVPMHPNYSPQAFDRNPSYILG
jgi:hypothetical protein